MNDNGQVTGAENGRVRAWPRRVLSAADLRQGVDRHRELVLAPDTVVTPLAGEELRTNGIRIVRQAPGPAKTTATWGHAQDRPYPLVQSAVQALAREGLRWHQWPSLGDDLPCRWAKVAAECVARGECAGGVLFCADPGLVCCVANKVPGLRAVAVTTVAQAARATLALAANLLVVEMPGRTFFEVRQILRTLPGSSSCCPDGVACTLRELDGHAHR
jgi:hypothetical protein